MSDDTPASHGPPSYFVTGYPGLIGRRLVEHLVREAPGTRVWALVQPSRLS
jgi:thioester reductase-like protein